MSDSSDDDQSTRLERTGPSARNDDDELPRGASVGRYVIIERVGRGGMSTVYRAYDPKLRRDVALKMLRRDLVDAVGESQLVDEAQAMARISHANVVVVYDVIATPGGVAIAIELLEGGTAAAWLAQPRAPEEILALFIAAGRGLATAHAAGLVHRDFKPSNVLLGADGVAKVGDFGLAQPGPAIPAAAATSSAEHDADDDGGIVAGTPRFMPLEQLLGRTVDARADQYAFCVALWEALAGRQLFSGDVGALRLAKRSPAPPLPSSAAVAPTIAAAIARGLSVDAADRWPDMQGLLAALAFDPSRARRRRLAIAGATVGILGLAAAAWSLRPPPACSDPAAPLAGVWDGPRARADASPMEQRLGEQIDAYATDWIEHHHRACAATKLARTQTVAQMDLRMACLWQAKAELAAVVDLAQREGSAASALEVAVALPLLDRCDDVAALEQRARRTRNLGDSPARRAFVEAVAGASAALRSGEHASMEDEARELLAQARADGDRASVVDAATLLARVHGHGGHFAEAEAAFAEAIDAAFASGDVSLQLTATSLLAFHLTDEVAQPQRALWVTRIGVGLAGTEGADPLAAAEAYSMHGIALRGIGRYEESEAAHRRALALRIETVGPSHFSIAATRTNLGLTLYDRGEPEQAVIEHTAALEIWRGLLGDDHPRVGAARGNLGNALEASGKSEEAVSELRQALELRLLAEAPDHADIGIARNDLAIALQSVGLYADAERELTEAIRIWTSTHGESSRWVAFAYNNLGLALEHQNRLDEAAAAFRRAITTLEVVLGPEHPVLPRILGNLARAHLALGRLDESVAGFRRALALLEPRAQTDADARRSSARVSARLAEALLRRGERDEARRVLASAQAIADAAPEVTADDRAEIQRVAALFE